MHDETRPGLPGDFETDAERALWRELGDLPAEEPSRRLRQGFYRRLEATRRQTVLGRLATTLGFGRSAGRLTAAASLLAGLALGFWLGFGLGAPGGTPIDDAGARLAALEKNVTELNRQLILDRLDSNVPGKRLRGVLDAASVARGDAEIARALLVRATDDRVPSVRSAAIDALGPSIEAPPVRRRVMDLLQQASSPIVQLALVDLVLRYGNEEQIAELSALAEEDRLHPDLKRHVLTALQKETA